MDEEYLLKRIEHCEKRLEPLKELEKQKNLTNAGYRSLGYWSGKIDAYDMMIAELEKEEASKNEGI